MKTDAPQDTNGRRAKGAGSILRRCGHFYLRVRRNGNEKLLLLTGADNTPVTTMRQADEAASLVRMAIESKTLTELETFVKLVKFKLSA